MINIINHYHHPEGKRAGELVMRGTPLGNPFRLEDYSGDRDKVYDLYETWLRDQIQKKNPIVIEEINRLYCKWKSEGVLNLVCCCAPKRCHAESIRKEIMKMSPLSNPPTLKIYAGIGAVETPGEICELMTKIGKRFAELGWELSSGAAKGADSAFEKGCDQAQGKKRIFRFGDAEPKAYQIAEQLHPAWDRMTDYGKGLQARNVHQVLGANLRKVEPVRFICCWTPRGASIDINGISRMNPVTTIDDGGTGQAIRVANQWNQIRIQNNQMSWIIPVFNLRNEGEFEEMLQFIKEIG